jgi:hypothetical protein
LHCTIVFDVVVGCPTGVFAAAKCNFKVELLKLNMFVPAHLKNIVLCVFVATVLIVKSLTVHKQCAFESVAYRAAMVLRAFSKLIEKECAHPRERAILRYLEAGHGVNDPDVAFPHGTLLHTALSAASKMQVLAAVKVLLGAGQYLFAMSIRY